MGDRGLRLRGGLAGGRARGRALPDLHLGHDRAAEGRPAHPRQHDRRLAGLRRRPRGPGPAGARSPSCPAPTSPTAGRRTTGRCSSAHACTAAPTREQMVAYSIEVKPTAWGGVPRIWEKLKAALETGDGRRAGRGETRGRPSGRSRSAAGKVAAYMDGGVPDDLQAEWEQADEKVFSEDPLAARPRRDRMVRGRGGADAARGARVLPRDRDRDLRDLGDVGDQRDGDASTRPARCGSARSARRCPTPR